MNILLKHTIKSATKNKGQVVVIILTIVIVTMMIFAAFSMSDMFFNINMITFNRLPQGAEAMLGGYNGPLFSKSLADNVLFKHKNDIDYAEYYYTSSGMLKTSETSSYINLEATDLKDYFLRHTIKYYDKLETSNEYPQILISQTFADKYSLHVGDTVELVYPTLSGFKKFTVQYITYNEGLFGNPAANNVLIDYAEAQTSGLVSAVVIKLKAGSSVSDLAKDFAETLPKVSYGEASNLSLVSEYAKNNTLLFNVALVFVGALMCVILFTSYLIIARNRVSEMVIFKASGATPGQTTLILMLEVLFYGLIGSVLGVLIGRIFLGIMTSAFLPTVTKAITYPFHKYLLSILGGVSVSVLASLLPMLRLSRRSIRDSLSNSSNNFKPARPIFAIIITIILILGIALINLISDTDYIIYALLVLFPILIGFIAIVSPYLIQFFSFLATKIHLSGALRLSGVSIKRNSASHTVSILISAVVAFTFITATIINIVIIAVTPTNSKLSGDYILTLPSDISSTERIKINNKIVSTKGVGSVGFYSERYMKFTKDKNVLSNYETQLFSISDSEMLNVVTQTSYSADIMTAFKNNPNAIVLNEDLMLRYNLNIGDEIFLYTDQYNTDGVTTVFLDNAFTIVGVDFTKTRWDRNACIHYSANKINEKELSLNTNYIIAAKDNADKSSLFLELRTTLENELGSLALFLPMTEWLAIESGGLEGLSGLLQSLQVLLFFVSGLGMLNIIIVTVYDREKELKIYRFAGVSASEYVKLAIGEAIIIGSSGTAVGILLAYFINQLVPLINSIIGRFFSIQGFPIIILVMAGITFLLFVGSWISVAIGNRKRYSNNTAINERLI